jgi:hypothetical protein
MVNCKVRDIIKMINGVLVSFVAIKNGGIHDTNYFSHDVINDIADNNLEHIYNVSSDDIALICDIMNKKFKGFYINSPVVFENKYSLIVEYEE